MKRVIWIILVVVLVVLSGATSNLWAQTNALSLSAPPPPAVAATSISAQVTGTAGTQTYYYWVVARYPVGNSFPGGPALVRYVPDTLSGANFVTVRWNRLNGATSYDVLRTTTPNFPSGTANILVAGAVAGPAQVDVSNVVGAYTLATIGGANFVLELNNANYAQARLVGNRPFHNFQVRGTFDASLATNTLPNELVTGAPVGACVNGETIQRTDISAIYTCIANVWTLTSSVPFGPAGGALAGTYPNPTLAPDQTYRSWLSTGYTFATLPAAANGTSVYCSDCIQAIVCAGAGTGAWALRINGAWSCSSGAGPIGAAGGALAGTYPNPTLAGLATVNVLPKISAAPGVLEESMITCSNSPLMCTVYDPTPTTGKTTLEVRAGAGQAGANLQEWRTAAGAILSSVTDVGNFITPGISNPAGTWSIVYGGLTLHNTLGSLGWSDIRLSRNAAGILEHNSGTAGRWAGLRTGNIQMQSLATPGIPVVTPQGAPGGTNWSYVIVALLADGTTNTAAGAVGTTAGGNAVLDGTNFNRVTWAAVAGATSYNVRRTVAGGVPNTTGKVGSVTAPALTFNDTGLAGDGTASPTTNVTGAISARSFVGQAVVFADLGTPANGTFVYCSDCTIASPCAGAGTGALAKMLNAVWVCN